MFTYFPLWKSFEKHSKPIEEQGKKQIETLEILKPEENKKGTKQFDGYFPKDQKKLKKLREWKKFKIK